MSRSVIYLGLFIGSLVGSYLPVLFGSSFIGGWSLLGGVVGGLAGIWAATKL